MTFKEQVEKELKGLKREQIVFFSWVCAVRSLPLLGIKGDFSFWDEEDRQKHLFRVLYAIDLTYAASSATAADAIVTVTAADAANAAASAASSSSVVAAAAASSANAAANAVYAAYAANANTKIASNTIYTAAANTADAAAAAANVVGDNASGIKKSILVDLKKIKAGQLHLFHNSNYENILTKFQKALRESGCEYWADWYLRLFSANDNNQKVLYEEIVLRLQIPIEVKEKGASAVGQYFSNLNQQGAKPLNEGKMILLGDGAAGKTALVERLLHGTFSGTTEMTEGIDIQQWNTGEITLNIWDFGGQEIMRAMHQFFMTPRTLYLLVCTHRTDESDSHVEDWLRLIQTFGGNSPIFIVKSKCDAHELNLDNHRLKENYPNIIDFFSTSAKEGTSIPELKRAIENVLSHAELKHIKDPIPKNQLSVKDSIQETQKIENYISMNRYYTICNDNQVVDESEQSSLLDLLHDLGIAFNYGTQEYRHNTNVLKPEWVTKGIYAIINNNDLFKQEGRVKLSDLKRVLIPKEDYKDKENVIMDLMDKFDLCFSIGENEYLVPDLLPKKQPYLSDKFKESLCLEYHYELLPRSIMPHFICRTNEMAMDYWLHGVILKKENNDALVQVDYKRNKISIFINGDQASRRDFMDTIRQYLNELNSRIKRRQPSIMIPITDYPSKVVSYNWFVQLERKGIKEIYVEDVGLVEVKRLLDHIENENNRVEARDIEKLIVLYKNQKIKEWRIRSSAPIVIGLFFFTLVVVFFLSQSNWNGQNAWTNFSNWTQNIIAKALLFIGGVYFSITVKMIYDCWISRPQLENFKKGINIPEHFYDYNFVKGELLRIELGSNKLRYFLRSKFSRNK